MPSLQNDTSPFLRDIILIFTTGITNIFFLAPAIMTYKRKSYFEAYCLAMISFTSTIYHLQESILPKNLILTQLEWHAIDNVFSITTALNIIIYLMDNDDNSKDIQLQYFGITLSMFSQLKDPWNIYYTIFPVMFMAVLGIFVIFRTPKPRKYNFWILNRGFSLFLPGFICFYFGLNDMLDDPYRLCHAGWHTLIGLSVFYLLQAKVKDNQFLSLRNLLYHQSDEEKSSLVTNSVQETP